MSISPDEATDAKRFIVRCGTRKFIIYAKNYMHALQLFGNDEPNLFSEEKILDIQLDTIYRDGY